MLNIFLLTYFTKKLDLVIIESKDSISSVYGEYLKSIFNSVKVYTTQKEFLKEIQLNSFDVLLFDNEINNLESTFLFIKKVYSLNPLINIILFSKYVDTQMLMNTLKYNVTGFMYNKSNEQDLKDFFKVSVRKLLMNNSHKFMENKNKFDVINCLNFLKNEQNIVSIVNHFKGIAIVREGEVTKYTEELITIKTNPIQIKTIKINDHIVISSMHLGVEILTIAKEIDTKNNEIKVKYNNLIDSYVHHRKTPRVEPKIGASAIVKTDEVEIKLDITNISIDHILCNMEDIDFNFKIHSNVKIFIDCFFEQSLTNAFNYKIKAVGFIKELFYTIDGNKILFKFKLNKKDHFILDKYIEYRIKEIVKELKDKTHNS